MRAVPPLAPFLVSVGRGACRLLAGIPPPSVAGLYFLRMPWITVGRGAARGRMLFAKLGGVLNNKRGRRPGGIGIGFLS